ncbi:hypothetical protein H1O16_gp037 [Burkholderia phage BcepSaruman]|uniref:Uncharacterized protein n=1 Tax=Burkholderia phage BcepSaruman TaxID=2530032 RepID=A0A4D5ZCR7_9CAUD|nr:hypothetical protein H1O16_gp037 [Burkholderia phage BcepSaruman]QBX06450.1 hypothetical protein BcepSaruman_037 [Burkholderia phage BcepSaruman]
MAKANIIAIRTAANGNVEAFTSKESAVKAMMALGLSRAVAREAATSTVTDDESHTFTVAGSGVTFSVSRPENFASDEAPSVEVKAEQAPAPAPSVEVAADNADDVSTKADADEAPAVEVKDAQETQPEPAALSRTARRMVKRALARTQNRRTAPRSGLLSGLLSRAA